jgi:hypothetical protein
MSKILFSSLDSHIDYVAPKPMPASKNIPNSWKNMPVYLNGDSKIKIRNSEPNLTGKKCIPMLEAITIGYHIPLSADIQVSKQGTESFFTWKSKLSIVTMHHKDQVKGLDIPYGFNDQPFKWSGMFFIKTPPGWSSLFIHPNGYSDMPFKTISGVVDTDVYEQEIAFPFWIRDDFEGIIEQGTPIVQVIPFKRDSWKSEFSCFEDGELLKRKDKGNNAKIINNYLSRFRQKKEYR